AFYLETHFTRLHQQRMRFVGISRQVECRAKYLGSGISRVNDKWPVRIMCNGEEPLAHQLHQASPFTKHLRIFQAATTVQVHQGSIIQRQLGLPAGRYVKYAERHGLGYSFIVAHWPKE